MTDIISKQVDLLFKAIAKVKLVLFNYNNQIKINRLLYTGTPGHIKAQHDAQNSTIHINGESFHLDTQDKETTLFVNTSNDHFNNNISYILQIRLKDSFLAVGLQHTQQQIDFSKIRERLQIEFIKIQEICKVYFQQQSSQQENNKPLLQLDCSDNQYFTYQNKQYIYLQHPNVFQKQKYTVLAILNQQYDRFEYLLQKYVQFANQKEAQFNYIFAIQNCNSQNFEQLTSRTTLFKQLNIIEDKNGFCQQFLADQTLSVNQQNSSKQIQKIILIDNYPRQQLFDDIDGQQPNTHNIQNQEVHQEAVKNVKLPPLKKQPERNQSPQLVLYNQKRKAEQQKQIQVQLEKKQQPKIETSFDSLNDLIRYFKTQQLKIDCSNSPPCEFNIEKQLFSILGVETQLLIRREPDFVNNYTIILFANPKQHQFQQLLNQILNLTNQLKRPFNYFVCCQGVNEVCYNQQQLEVKYFNFVQNPNFRQINIIFDENNIFRVIFDNFVRFQNVQQQENRSASPFKKQLFNYSKSINSQILNSSVLKQKQNNTQQQQENVQQDPRCCFLYDNQRVHAEGCSFEQLLLQLQLLINDQNQFQSEKFQSEILAQTQQQQNNSLFKTVNKVE